MSSILAKLKTVAVTIGDDLYDFLKTVLRNELDALAPIVEAAIPTVLSAGVDLGTPAGWIGEVVAVAEAVLPELEKAGIKVAGSSLLLAIGAALHKVAPVPTAEASPPEPAADAA